MIISGINLVMTVIGFAVSTMFMVFVCTRLICARMQLNASRRSFPTASRSDISLLERGLRGLEPVHVATFPTKKFSDEFFSSEEDSQCTVCLAEYQEKDILRILPYCGHSFHVTCIDIWLQQHSTCPICRISLRESPDRKRIMQPMFSSAIRSPHGLHSPSGYSSTAENRRMGPVQESLDASQVDTANTDESVSSFMEGIRVPKEISHEAKNKCIESPSNT